LTSNAIIAQLPAASNTEKAKAICSKLKYGNSAAVLKTVLSAFLLQRKEIFVIYIIHIFTKSFCEHWY